ncbi:MAG: hypothetical protein PHH54_01415 [Candidatus Nanoarchaeia archaeon]|nr:hypothetical protein [Candidatus Nanoarchaeia archaeon]MDD5740622.1 hypothetical protein [Candidatus Nanoarchaeia archaeon]
MALAREKAHVIINKIIKKEAMKRKSKAQISFEYLIIMGFVTFIIFMVLGIAIFYSGGIKDRIKITQMTNCANKIISTAEGVFYAGNPSRATITCQLPENIQEIYIGDNSLVISIQTSSGLERRAFSSNVPISEGTDWLTISPGIKKIKLEALDSGNTVEISKG